MATLQHADLKKIRKFALSLPGTVERPVDHLAVFAVQNRVVAFVGGDRSGQSLTVNLPKSGRQLLRLSCAAPAFDGLGKRGWVTVWIGKRDTPPVGTLTRCVEESYRAVAPAELAGQLSSTTTRTHGRRGTRRNGAGIRNG